MTIEVVKDNLTISVATSTDDPHWPNYMHEFAQAVKLIQAGVIASNITRVFCRYAGPPGEFRSEYHFAAGPTFELRRDTTAVPNTVRVIGTGPFTDEDRATIDRIHQEIEHLRLSFALTSFDWVQT